MSVQRQQVLTVARLSYGSANTDLEKGINEMRTYAAAALLIAATAILAASTAVTPSSANTATTWTVAPGGNAVAKSGVIRLTDTKTKKAGVCASSTVDGNLKAGTGLPGTGIGSVTAATFRTCTGPAKVPFTVKASDLPWTISFASYDPATGVVRGTVSGIRVVITATAETTCSAVVNGTAGSTADGVIGATYTDGTGTLKFLATGGNLHFWHVKNCAPLLNNADRATLSGIYTVTPRQVITSP